MYYHVKRVLDILFGVLTLVLLSPLLLVIMLVLTVTTHGKPIFRQQRAGRFGQPFYVYKFRTMQPDAPPNMPTMDFEDANRYITPFGHFLRNTSFDELPQLWNVLKGDMSFIGPRPVVLQEAELLRQRQKLHADAMRPGITGLAQVRGRDQVDIAHKARYDAYYYHHFSFRLDMQILFMTVICVFTHRGIQEGKIPHEDAVSDEPQTPAV